MATATATRVEIKDLNHAIDLLTSSTISREEFTAWDNEQKAKIKAERTITAGQITCKHHPKGVKYKDSKGVQRDGTGVVSVYGFGRWPISLYAPQWQRMFEGCDGPVAKLVLDYCEKHRNELSWTKE